MACDELRVELEPSMMVRCNWTQERLPEIVEYELKFIIFIFCINKFTLMFESYKIVSCLTAIIRL